LIKGDRQKGSRILILVKGDRQKGSRILILVKGGRQMGPHISCWLKGIARRDSKFRRIAVKDKFQINQASTRSVSGNSVLGLSL